MATDIEFASAYRFGSDMPLRRELIAHAMPSLFTSTVSFQQGSVVIFNCCALSFAPAGWMSRISTSVPVMKKVNVRRKDPI